MTSSAVARRAAAAPSKYARPISKSSDGRIYISEYRGATPPPPAPNITVIRIMFTALDKGIKLALSRLVSLTLNQTDGFRAKRFSPRRALPEKFFPYCMEEFRCVQIL